MKKYLLTSFVAGLLLIGGGCSRNRQTDLNSASTTLATPTTNTTASDIIPTSTPTLIDKPISEWPRYEFKELGFSIQLPFVSSSLHYGFNYCSFCINTSTYQYTGVVLSDNAPRYNFIGSYALNYQYDRDGDITDIVDFEIGKNPKLVFFGLEKFKLEIKPLKRIVLQHNEVVIFDATDTSGDINPYFSNKRWAFALRLPTSKKFRAVLITFYDSDVPFEKMIDVVKTIRFSSL